MTPRLFTPGPVPILPKALEVMSHPIIHHRSTDFIQVFSEVREGLKYLFDTQEEILILSSSGTGAMEGTVLNLCSPGDEVIVVRAGKFGERWGQIAQTYGLKVIPLDISWGEAPTGAQIEALIKKYPTVKAIFLQACETSTGVDFPIEEIARFTRTQDLLLVVDAISYLGVSPLKMDEWGIDVVVTGSQKGLMLPPGLSFVALSKRAWARQKTSTLPKYYFNFSKELKAVLENQTAYTPAISLILGLREVLKYYKAEGKETIFRRHKKYAQAMREAVKALNLELFAKNPSNSLVSICVPQGVDGKKIITLLRDEYQMTIIGGQDQLKGKIIRIGCMGYVGAQDLISVFEALEKVLKTLGANIPVGKGVEKLKAVLGKER
ncbi:MAG: class V aminotransferase [Deltaproteobacteria bacterium GWA2_38_16]|nr:MAG: class V aminotransferase [Deltaproteobacteria bacterium GWA2_38_16]OGQ02497.1 MAG: class V aminotransferase [Deltaproteobacteria bacterium RIFCSPHIGHO2_02_FULL_38_15]OGQ33212.1 MAG: class V aminotransferase [Deltaproteobacteria bacterium RIFCSPLOWO2_01_FULL_38_9]HBQ21048.1 aminotransferase [Deltaproteobacteria bacterium]